MFVRTESAGKRRQQQWYTKVPDGRSDAMGGPAPPVADRKAVYPDSQRQDLGDDETSSAGYGDIAAFGLSTGPTALLHLYLKAKSCG